MRATAVRCIVMTCCAVLGGSCTAPAGISRTAAVGLRIEAACFERGVRETKGLTNIASENYLSPPSSPDKLDRSSVSYDAAEITDALDAIGVTFEIYRSQNPDHSNIVHRFDRNNNRGVSKIQVQQAVDLMKRVEASVGAACGIDIVRAMSMNCGPSLNSCEGIV